MTVIQAKDPGGLDQEGNSGREITKFWTYFQGTAFFSDGLNVGCQVRRGIKNDSNVFGKLELPVTEVQDTVRGADCGESGMAGVQLWSYPSPFIMYPSGGAK